MARQAAMLSAAASLAACGPSTSPPSPLTVPVPPPHAPCPSPAEVQIADGARQGSLLYGHVGKPPFDVTLDGRSVPLAPDGRFLVAFDRDAAPSALLRVTWNALCSVERRLAIAPGDWDIQHVDASITGGLTGAAFQRRRAPELARIAAARDRMRPDASMGWRQEFVLPVVARISGRFGAQRIYRGTPGSYHGGLDLAAAAGTVYVAPADGVVILAADAPFTLEGNLLIIDHGMGLNSAFLHSQRLLVKEGEVVRRGQPIGIVGATGRVTGPHLHWGMKWNEARIDPATIVNLDGR